jgi:hypothetical protein
MNKWKAPHNRKPTNNVGAMTELEVFVEKNHLWCQN